MRMPWSSSTEGAMHRMPSVKVLGLGFEGSFSSGWGFSHSKPASCKAWMAWSMVRGSGELVPQATRDSVSINRVMIICLLYMVFLLLVGYFRGNGGLAQWNNISMAGGVGIGDNGGYKSDNF